MSSFWETQYCFSYLSTCRSGTASLKWNRIAAWPCVVVDCPNTDSSDSLKLSARFPETAPHLNYLQTKSLCVVLFVAIRQPAVGVALVLPVLTATDPLPVAGCSVRSFGCSDRTNELRQYCAQYPQNPCFYRLHWVAILRQWPNKLQKHRTECGPPDRTCLERCPLFR